MKYRIVGLDPSLRNLGIAKGYFDTETKKLTIDTCMTVCPKVSKGKLRVGTKDILRVRYLLGSHYLMLLFRVPEMMKKRECLGSALLFWSGLLVIRPSLLGLESEGPQKRVSFESYKVVFHKELSVTS
jgi:hypothetical protein